MVSSFKRPPVPPSHREKPISADAIAQVNRTLRGPVLDVIRSLVPDLKTMDRKQAYDSIMNNTDLVAACFQLFRKKPDLFEKVLPSIANSAELRGDDILICGCSLDEVIALIVRATAKRHFTTKLGMSAYAHHPKAKTKLIDRLLHRAIGPAPLSSVTSHAKQTHAEALYLALRDFLLFEWQVPLIPHYVPLPVSLVHSLKERILDYRSPAELQSLLHPTKQKTQPRKRLPQHAPAMPRPQRPPRLAAGSANANATPSAEAIWTHCQTLDIKTVLGLDDIELRNMIAHVSAVSPLAIASLRSIDLPPPAIVTILCTIDKQLGHIQMSKLLGATASPIFLQTMVSRLRKESFTEALSAAEMRDKTINALEWLRSSSNPPLSSNS